MVGLSHRGKRATMAGGNKNGTGVVNSAQTEAWQTRRGTR